MNTNTLINGIMAGRLLAVPSNRLALRYGWIFLAAPILFKIGPKVKMEALVTPPSKIVVKAMPIIHTSSAPFAVPAILLFKIFSAIRFSIPASLKMPMMPNTEMTNAQVGKILLIPSIKNPTAALLAASLENTCAGVNSPAIRPTMVPVTRPTRIP